MDETTVKTRCSLFNHSTCQFCWGKEIIEIIISHQLCPVDNGALRLYGWSLTAKTSNVLKSMVVSGSPKRWDPVAYNPPEGKDYKCYISGIFPASWGDLYVTYHLSRGTISTTIKLVAHVAGSRSRCSTSRGSRRSRVVPPQAKIWFFRDGWMPKIGECSRLDISKPVDFQYTCWISSVHLLYSYQPFPLKKVWWNQYFWKEICWKAWFQGYCF